MSLRGEDMFQLKFKRVTKQRAGKMPVIRKIFRQGKDYFCGLCHRSHDREDDALFCLNSCWTAVLALPAVIHDEKRKEFKCRFCSRTFPEEQTALECARDCRDEYRKRHYVDVKLFELPPEEISYRKFELTTVKTKMKRDFVSKIKWKRSSPTEQGASESEENQPVSADVPVDKGQPSEGETTPEVSATAPSETLDPRDQEPGEEIPDSEAASSEPKRRNKSSFAKTWVRKDAKYQCMCCLQDYFTRIEVEKCFDGHFDEEGKEILDHGLDLAS